MCVCVKGRTKKGDTYSKMEREEMIKCRKGFVKVVELTGKVYRW